MPKDFDGWNNLKKQIQDRLTPHLFFKEREVWWCAIGTNIGSEEDGKNRDFSRPVVILKKFSDQNFMAAPFTTSLKTGKYLFRVPFTIKKESIIFSQIRFLDVRRLINKISKIDSSTFLQLQKIIATELFSNDSYENFVPPASK